MKAADTAGQAVFLVVDGDDDVEHDGLRRA